MFGRSDEIAYLRAELSKQQERYDRIVERYSAAIESMRRDGFVAAPPAAPDEPFDMPTDIAPSIEVAIDECAELSPRPEEVRRALNRFAALKSTQGKSEAEIVALIQKGGDVGDEIDPDDEEAFV